MLFAIHNKSLSVTSEYVNEVLLESPKDGAVCPNQVTRSFGPFSPALSNL